MYVKPHIFQISNPQGGKRYEVENGALKEELAETRVARGRPHLTGRRESGRWLDGGCTAGSQSGNLGREFRHCSSYATTGRDFRAHPVNRHRI